MKKTVILILALIVLFPFYTSAREENEKEGTVAVIGSSVAAGWVTSYKERHDMKNGYAFRLGKLLEPGGYKVVNISIPGDDTKGVLARMEKDLFPLNADFVIIGLSMANEGLETEDPDKVFDSYAQGMKKIIEKCRENGILPVLGSCYPNDNYDEKEYRYIKKMNLLTNTWEVPNINFLGAVDDGAGRFPEGCTFDPNHPDNRGHEEMLFAVVPSLFEALRAGKPVPQKKASGFASIRGKAKASPLSFIPEDIIHSFTLAFSIRTSSKGSIAAVVGNDASALLEIGKDKRFSYQSSSGKRITSKVKAIKNKWHNVVISHRYLKGETLFFVDGELGGTVPERFAPIQFVLGGIGTAKGEKAPSKTDYREWLIYRASLNEDEVEALHEGKLLQASLEVYAPLDSVTLKPNASVENLAQSLSRVFAYPSNTVVALDSIRNKQKLARQAREKEPVFPEKTAIKVAAKILDDYVGEYQLAPGYVIKILKEGDRLFADPNNEGKVELHPESKTKFFIKYPVEDITITFVKDKAGKVTKLLFGMGGREDPAGKIL